MTDLIDRIHFDDLAKQNPLEVCRRTLCDYNPEEKYYTLSVWGTDYRIAPVEGTIDRLGDPPYRDHGFLSLFILHYLLAGEDTALTNTWISEKEIPGGATFFRGPHALPTHRITERFENDLDAFANHCEILLGSRLEMADAAFRFEIAPGIPVAVLYWCGDEDFPAEAKLLFDKSIYRHLATDVIYALAVGVCERLGV